MLGSLLACGKVSAVPLDSFLHFTSHGRRLPSWFNDEIRIPENRCPFLNTSKSFWTNILQASNVEVQESSLRTLYYKLQMDDKFLASFKSIYHQSYWVNFHPHYSRHRLPFFLDYSTHVETLLKIRKRLLLYFVFFKVTGRYSDQYHRYTCQENLLL